MDTVRQSIANHQETRVNINPCREQNAIVAAGFAFEFEREFDQSSYLELFSLHQGEKDSLPRRQLQSGLKFQLSPSGVSQKQTEEIVGIVFDRINPSGVPQWIFSATANLAVVQCREYTSWHAVFAQVNEYFRRFLPTLMKEQNPIRSIVLEYKDEFIIVSPEKPWVSDLFSTKTDLLPNRIFNEPIDKNLWHSHFGFFSTSKANHKILNKLAIDYIQEQTSPLVANMTSKALIVATHRVQAATQDEPQKVFDLDDLSVFDHMHSENLNMLNSVLSEGMRKRVGLT